ncbi:FAD dependent oxidoreductase [Spinellus fusiger]|nr:FAD dependent oxidoreductase [Spinellus fusiger]
MPRHVIILGAGVMGACSAYYLSLKSPTVTITVIEASDIANGASGKAGGFLAFDWSDGTETAELSRKSFDLHAELAETLGGESYGYRPVTAYSVLVQSGKQTHTSEVDWLLHANVRTVELLGTKNTSAQIHPRLFTHQLLAKAEATGRVRVMCEQTVTGLIYAQDEPSKVVGVTLKDGTTLKGDDVVVCMGPWSGQLALKGRTKRSQLPISGARAHSIVLQPQAKFPPQVLFTAVVEGSKSHEPEVYPRSDGTVYLCGATDNEPLPASVDLVKVDPAATSLLQQMAAKISPHLSEEKAPLQIGQACYLPISRDNVPLIGAHPGYKQLYMATGHSCWGILNSPVTGLMIAELLLEGEISCLDSKSVEAVSPLGRC